MSNKITKLMKNFSYTLSSNMVTLLVSFLVIIIVPKFMDVEQYGYWQLYLFYSSYVGLLHFGWNDGIYLRYGGMEYKNLNKNLFCSQFYMLLILQLIIAVVMCIVPNIINLSHDNGFIMQVISISLILINVRYMLLYILQATNRMKSYAAIIILSKILFGILVVIILISGINEYKYMVLADLVANLISLIYAMYCCRDIVFRKFSAASIDLQEAFENINVGIKLMFANLASMLIIGVIRFGIERSWDVSTFGKVSLILNISNLLMTFLSAMGIVLFPILKRTKVENLPNIYITIRTILMPILLGMLLVYYPLKVILLSWLPSYAESFKYMAILFPMCVYQGKMTLLINTYLNTLRKEKVVLKINLFLLFLSTIVSFITTYVMRNLEMALLAIVILLALRCIFAEIVLAKILGISIYKDIILEIALTIIFIGISWFIDSWSVFGIYLCVYIIYLVLKKNDVIKDFNRIKKLMKAR
ncbi:oligosaccharide flippase family protein [Bacillus luti]